MNDCPICKQRISSAKCKCDWKERNRALTEKFKAENIKTPVDQAAFDFACSPEYLNEYSPDCYQENEMDAFKAGAAWQKERDAQICDGAAMQYLEDAKQAKWNEEIDRLEHFAEGAGECAEAIRKQP